MKIKTLKNFIESFFSFFDEKDQTCQKLNFFLYFLLIHYSARFWVHYLTGEDHTTIDKWIQLCWALGMTGCLIVSINKRWISISLKIAAVLLTIKYFYFFPFNSNHLFLETILTYILVFCRLNNSEERLLMLNTIKWMTLAILFYTGFQKFLHGWYFSGEYLSVAISREPKFANFFNMFISDEATHKLVLQSNYEVGSGPFRIDSILFLLISNGSYLIEIIAPFFLVLKKTRKWTILFLIVFIVLIECAAREFFFGLLFINLILLFSKENWNRWGLIFGGIFYIYLIGVCIHIFPLVEFN